MIMLNTSTPFRFTPEWREEGAKAPTFLLRAGDIFEREMLEAELAGPYRAPRVMSWELSAAFVDGVRGLLADSPDADRIVELASAEDEDLPMADRQLLAEVANILMQHWPEYRELRSSIARRQSILPALAFRTFCVGWEGVHDRSENDLPFQCEADGMVSRKLMGQLIPIDMRLAGLRAYGLLYANEHVGNSERPSKSDDGLPTSSSDEVSQAAGKSKAKGGPKTRG